jgi:hypothetical protein
MTRSLEVPARHSPNHLFLPNREKASCREHDAHGGECRVEGDYI